jgi:hypothetical protein
MADDNQSNMLCFLLHLRAMDVASERLLIVVCYAMLVASSGLPAFCDWWRRVVVSCRCCQLPSGLAVGIGCVVWHGADAERSTNLVLVDPSCLGQTKLPTCGASAERVTNFVTVDQSCDGRPIL